jgi:5'-3' exonuclease|tara:strand:- start:2346 stop:3053 length:708 start_codon:yes stop_codon:yes gene_type:complete
MILLIDADSLIFASCFKAKAKPDEEKHYKNIEDSIAKFDEQFMKIVNDMEEIYEIDKVITFNGSTGNFRKLITPKYKANRTAPKPILLNEMHKWVKETYQSISACGLETDDIVAHYWHSISSQIGRDNVMIVSIDKDYKQFPCLLYNYHYKHKKIYNISKQEALYNFYEQMITGDTADNINYFFGKGKAFAKKYLSGCNTKYKYTKKIYQLFKKQYKAKGKQNYIECYHLLKLRA